jgi:integrase
MKRTKALYENVTMRGRTVYIWLPLGPGKGRRRLAASWIRYNPNGRKTVESTLKAGFETLTRLETLLVNTLPPRWDIIKAIHDGRLDLQEVEATLMLPDGVKQLESKITSDAEQERRDTAVAPLIAQWPAMPLDSGTIPQETTRTDRRRRMNRIAACLPTLGQWTPDGLQEILRCVGTPKDGEPREPVGNWETQRTYRTDLRMFGAWLVARGLLLANPATDLKVDPRETRDIRNVSFDVLRRIYLQLPPGPPRDAFGLMMATGAEPQVVARVTPERLRPAEQKVELWGTKNAYRRRVAFVESWFWPRLVTLARGKRPDEALIPMTRFAIADSVREAVRALRMEDPALDLHADFVPYDVRHSFAARYVASGAVLRVLADQLGHRDERMIIQLYGRFRSDTSALAALESQAVKFVRAPVSALAAKDETPASASSDLTVPDSTSSVASM